MVDRRIFFALLASLLLVSVLHAELAAAADDDLQDEDIDDDEFDFDDDDNGDVIELIKRFWSKKKTTTEKPSTDAIAALFPTSKPNRKIPTTTASSIFDAMFGKKKSSTSRYEVSSSTSRYDSATRDKGSSFKDACGVINPCKNGGTCKTLSSGRYYCFCTRDYYGKTCEHKFITSGSANNDRLPKDHCASSPCRNGGECIGLRTTYYCRCELPYYGTDCDKSIKTREVFMDELSSSEQESDEYRRDLRDDTEDLRRALANEDLFEMIE